MLMAKSGAERLRMASGMFDSARRLMLASLPKNLPPATIRQLLLVRTYPELSLPHQTIDTLHDVSSL